MNDLQWIIVKNADLTLETRNSIAKLKNQHWPYGIESQKDWMDKNIQADDYHLLGLDEKGILRSYLTIVQVNVKFAEKEDKALGLGGVCVDKSIEHCGFGKKLVLIANNFIQSEGKVGLLLCKENLVEFYEKCKWVVVDCERAYVDGHIFAYKVMTYLHSLKCDCISIDRNF